VQRVSSKSLRHSESFIKVHLWLVDNGRSLLDAIYKAVWEGEHLLGLHSGVGQFYQRLLNLDRNICNFFHLLEKIKITRDLRSNSIKQKKKKCFSKPLTSDGTF
jgi:hypothetical protein